MADPADINLDDVRRRARRRLVGAIVLALAAAVIVPMLLESEPKPLGDSVAIRIPPVDDGKFTNRLNDGGPKGDAPAKDVSGDAAVDGGARTSLAEADSSVAGPAGKPKYDTQIAGKEAATGSAAAPAAGAAPSAAAPVAAPVAKPEPKAVEPAGAAAKNGDREGFAVQLAAFSDDKGANSLANRLKRGGYPAYTEPLRTSRGTLWRVRVGPFPSRDAANAMRDKLKSEGQNGIVSPIH